MIAGLAAYLWWGLVPVYFKAVAAVSPLEVLAHRIVWALVLLAVWLGLRGQLAGLAAAAPGGVARLGILASTALIAVNWLGFIWAVVTDRVLEASLGYFINPLVNVLLGMLILGERLRRLQWISVGLAAAGVILLAATRTEGLPWLALLLAFSFAFYGLLRKVSPVDAGSGLLAEVTLLAPAALGLLAWRAVRGDLAFGGDMKTSLLLVAAGPVTAVPLLLFVAAARRLPYGTIGFLQYVAPSLQFVLAVAVFGEPFGVPQAAAFGLIWFALLLFSIDMRRALGARVTDQPRARAARSTCSR
ncbi:MAG: EamA family transporter RarD [Acidobacteria bacterium]|nr:MAG: EamA family transporter RarD [Acidobacteriota bacterium]